MKKKKYLPPFLQCSHGCIHKLLTYGNPAYIEVIAPEHFPAVFKYAGAIDPKTKVLSTKRTSGIIRLLSGKTTVNGPAMSEQALYVLKSLNMQNGQQRYFTLDSCDLSAGSSSKTYTFIEDGGYPKNKVFHSSYPPHVAHNTPVSKYAEIGVTYSVNANGGNASSFEAKLYISEKGTSTETQLMPTTSKILDGRDYKCFQRSYYEQRYDLVGKLTKADTDYKPRLVIGTTEFKSMPYIKRNEVDVEETTRKAEKETEKFTNVSWKPEGDSDFGISMLGNVGQINFSAKGIPGYRFSIVPTIDVIRGIYEVDFNLSCGTSEEKDANGNLTAGESMRKRQKDLAVLRFVPVPPVSVDDGVGHRLRRRAFQVGQVFERRVHLQKERADHRAGGALVHGGFRLRPPLSLPGEGCRVRGGSDPAAVRLRQATGCARRRDAARKDAKPRASRSSD